MLLHPFMLAWLAGAAVPVVLHLLARGQYRAVPWGAMMFLPGNHSGSQVAIRFKQWALLLLRMCVVGLLAVTLARPVIGSRFAAVPTAGLTTAGPAAVVIILDDSASMGYQRDGKSRLDQARQVTLQILSSLKPGDEASLILAGGRDTQPPLPPNADLQSIAGRVADLQPDIGQSDFAADLLQAAELLDHASPAEHDIFLICDRQATSWRSVSDSFRRQWLSRKSASALPRVTVIPVGGDESDNLAVEGIEFANHAAIRGESTVAQVRIHNYGSEPAISVPITVWTGAQTLADITATIAPHAVTTVTIAGHFSEAGSHIVSAALKSSGLTTDDRLDYSLDVMDPPRVLWVSPATAPSSQPADGMAIAIDPLSSDQLNRCNVVVLDDVALVSGEQINELKRFLSTGGGVLLLPGTHVTAEEYNAALCSGSGILQLKILPPISKTSHLANFDRQHLLFRSFTEKTDPLSGVAIARMFPSTPLDANTHILARSNLGQPLLVESATGIGRTLMLTAIDRPPAGQLITMLIQYLGAHRAVDRNLLPGQPIVAITQDTVEEGSVTVQYVSAGPRDPATLTRLGDRTEIHYNKTNRPGLYRLRYRTAGKEKLLNYVVNAPRADSDLTNLTANQWKTLASRLKFDRLDLSQTSVAAALDLQRNGREIWIDLLGSVMLLMTAETLLSRWWSHSSDLNRVA